MDVLKVALVGGAINDRDHVGTAGSGGDAGIEAMDAMDSMDGSAHGVTRASQSAMAAEVISELGAKLLRHQMTSTPLVLTILR